MLFILETHSLALYMSSLQSHQEGAGVEKPIVNLPVVPLLLFNVKWQYCVRVGGVPFTLIYVPCHFNMCARSLHDEVVAYCKRNIYDFSRENACIDPAHNVYLLSDICGGP